MKASYEFYQYEALLLEAKRRGYKPGWAAYQYKDQFGEWPPEEMKVALVDLIQECDPDFSPDYDLYDMEPVYEGATVDPDPGFFGGLQFIMHD